MKKLLAMLLTLALMLSAIPAALAEQAPEISSRTATLYDHSATDASEITLYFLNGQTDIPYIDMDTALELQNRISVFSDDPGFKVTMETEGETYMLTRENGSHAIVDFGQNLIGWDNYNLFITASYAIQPLDIVGKSGFNADGEPELFQRSSTSFYRGSESMGVKLSDFEIELVYQDGMGYLPLQTFSDLFIAYTYTNLAFNGENVFMIESDALGDMMELYYAVEPGPRSEALARFTYLETCLSLQFNYGLKEKHNIPSFGTLFEQTDMAERLQSTDALEADVALLDVINGYIDDLHSGFRYASPYAGNVPVEANVNSISTNRIVSHMRKLKMTEMQVFPEGRPPYQEVGNTAYISFDHFELNDAYDYYDALENGGLENMLDDTIALIMYAHQQITRADSPIENVVIDLSTNTGGAADAAAYVIAWFLGECDLHLVDAMTGAQSTTVYHIDVNGDRAFDESDSVASLNRYCLISPVSFSCGNLVPCTFKSSCDVTLLGRRSGGGACAVQPLITADGTIWQVSSRLRLSTVANGSFYDVDEGAEPDVVIDKVADYYDREKLTNYINDLL